eukprot:COSAG06_NODE_656_length_13333_cov_6.485492_3_plen_179_part_00
MSKCRPALTSAGNNVRSYTMRPHMMSQHSVPAAFDSRRPPARRRARRRTVAQPSGIGCSVKQTACARNLAHPCCRVVVPGSAHIRPVARAQLTTPMAAAVKPAGGQRLGAQTRHVTCDPEARGMRVAAGGGANAIQACGRSAAAPGRREHATAEQPRSQHRAAKPGQQPASWAPTTRS